MEGDNCYEAYCRGDKLDYWENPFSEGTSDCLLLSGNIENEIDAKETIDFFQKIIVQNKILTSE